MGAIAAAGMTDNVIDLMTRKIRRLSQDAQQLLTLAACIGSPFQWSTLLTVSGRDANAAEAMLQEALDAGLVQSATDGYNDDHGRAPRASAYTFLHDRVQQAAYDSIDEHRKREVHLGVGRLLLAECGESVSEDRLFEIVNHLNVGRTLVTDAREQLQVARLNLAAGRKAKMSAAYLAACGYFEEGIALLGDDLWSPEYDLMFALRLEAAECQYLAGRFQRAEQYFETLLARAATPLDTAQVHNLRTVFYENLSRYQDAVASARQGLALFDIAFPDSEAHARVLLDQEIDAIDRLRARRTIASLVDLPLMTDERIRTAMRILTLMWAPAYIGGNPDIARWISALMVRLSLEHGLTEDSAYGCVTHAITTGPVRRDYIAAYEWGELALHVNDRFTDTKRRAKIHQQFHAHVKLWRRPFATCLPHAREACRSGLESGDFNYAGYGAVSESWPAFVISRSLDQFVRDYTPALALLERIQMADFGSALQVMLNWAAALQCRTAGGLSLADRHFDEESFIARHRGGAAAFFLTFLYTAKLQLGVLLGRHLEAVEMARKAREVTVVGTLWPVLIDFWGSLAIAGAWTAASPETQREYWSELTTARTTLKELAENCPENFRCFWLIVAGEMKRLEERLDEAVALYDEALTYARETGNLQMEALSNERLADAWLARHQEIAAAPFLRNACAAYAAWGATLKVRQLETAHGRLIGAAESVSRETTDLREASTTDVASLDMETVLKAARAISVEIELDELLRKLMIIAIENAGAERGLFLQQRDDTLVVEAEAIASSGRVDVRKSTPLESADDVSHGVVRYVRRTGHDLVVGNLSADERFARDPYVMRVQAKSVVCVQVGQPGRSAGLLYLENNLATEAFTPARIEMLRILAAQAAISLENARLYSELAVLKDRLLTENVYLQEEIRTQHNFNDIVGNSPGLLEVLRRVERVAPTESTVLILGETGVGKELFARAVHSRSRRADRPLVKVNCGAIAPGLVESELFGHVKGAFTGAIDKRIGRFEVANGGTILLDEVGELPLEAQVKLLRVLQEQEFEPVGSSRTVRVDVRVIAATNRNLEQAVREGTFRADLLYRLNVFPIDVPPLRQRKTDIPLLAGLFVSSLARKLGKPMQGFSARGMERLIEYSWPGNVRELQNVVERAAILASGPILEPESSFMASAPRASWAAAVPGAGDTLDHVQRSHILAVLKTTNGVVEGAKGAATILGLHPNTLRSRMKKLGITP